MASEEDFSDESGLVNTEKEISDGNGVSDNSNRNSMVAAATVFLNNKNIKTTPLHLKRAFLEKKGLTPSEIDMAFKLSESLSVELNKISQPAIPSVTGESILTRVRGFVLSTVAFTGTALAVFEVFQRYISPWFVGDGRDWQERMVEGQTELNENIATLTSTVNDLRRQVARGGEDKVKNPCNDIRVMDEMKDELKTLKSIMLGRNQFPSVPQARPTLPSWQLDGRTANGRADLEVPDVKYFERTTKEVLVKNKMEHCNGSTGDKLDDCNKNSDDDDADYNGGGDDDNDDKEDNDPGIIKAD